MLPVAVMVRVAVTGVPGTALNRVGLLFRVIPTTLGVMKVSPSIRLIPGLSTSVTVTSKGTWVPTAGSPLSGISAIPTTPVSPGGTVTSVRLVRVENPEGGLGRSNDR